MPQTASVIICLTTRDCSSGKHTHKFYSFEKMTLRMTHNYPHQKTTGLVSNLKLLLFSLHKRLVVCVTAYGRL